MISCTCICELCKTMDGNCIGLYYWQFTSLYNADIQSPPPPPTHTHKIREVYTMAVLLDPILDKRDLSLIRKYFVSYNVWYKVQYKIQFLALKAHTDSGKQEWCMMRYNSGRNKDLPLNRTVQTKSSYNSHALLCITQMRKHKILAFKIHELSNGGCIINSLRKRFTLHRKTVQRNFHT